VLTVTDDGPGLDPDELAQATTRFWRSTRRTGTTTGTGLGLAIAEQLLTGRGGRLELTPAQPRGLRARAVVPRAADEGGTS
jgi:signal transduction histidine kinase